MRDDTVGDGIMSELHREEEFAAERLASALESVERGHPLDQRDLEDPDLAPMVTATDILRRTWNAATPDPGYFARTRAALLAAMPAQTDEPDRPISILERLFRAPVLAPVGSAAAAAVITLLFTIFVLGSDESTVIPTAAIPAPAESAAVAQVLIAPRVPASELAGQLGRGASISAQFVDFEVRRIASALDQLVEQSRRGELLDIALLRTITESTTSVARTIESAPGAMKRASVLHFVQTVADGQGTLRALRVVPGSTSALAAALSATQDGVVSGGTFLLNTLSE